MHQVYAGFADQRWVTRHFDEVVLEKADHAATAELMKQRMAIVEPPFGTLKRYLNQGRFTCWGAGVGTQ